MSNLQMIEKLCQLVELQNSIIQEQAGALAQMGAACCEDKRAQAREMAAVFCQDDG